LAGDQLVAIDTFNTDGWTVQEVSDKMHGALGTNLTITVLHAGQQRPVMMTLERSVVHIPTVPYALIMDGTVGYIPLLQFGDQTEAELASAISDVVHRGATSLIIDLRGDPGGLLQQAVDVSSFFLPLGAPVVTLSSRLGNTVYRVKTAPVQPDIPLVLLVDGHTASASEIVAGALQDHDRALVVGVPTFGKAVAQELFPVDGGYVLRLTTAKWYTPNGRLIHRDRTVLESGEVVELHPDSFPNDLSGRGRPTFSSDAGRLVYGGGGIMPDLIVAGGDVTNAGVTSTLFDSTAARKSLEHDRQLQRAITLLKESANQKTLFSMAEHAPAEPRQ
jgi:carboxyl-terminal processing protease